MTFLSDTVKPQRIILTNSWYIIIHTVTSISSTYYFWTFIFLSHTSQTYVERSIGLHFRLLAFTEHLIFKSTYTSLMILGGSRKVVWETCNFYNCNDWQNYSCRINHLNGQTAGSMQKVDTNTYVSGYSTPPAREDCGVSSSRDR